MSVGGRVIETIDCGDGDPEVEEQFPRGRVWINTVDQSRTECAIFVERTHEARAVSVGDSVWWQGKHAFWTPHPKDGSEPPFSDYKLKRRGCSGVARPDILVVHAGVFADATGEA